MWDPKHLAPVQADLLRFVKVPFNYRVVDG